jgi:hypothetical protein
MNRSAELKQKAAARTLLENTILPSRFTMPHFAIHEKIDFIHRQTRLPSP